MNKSTAFLCSLIPLGYSLIFAESVASKNDAAKPVENTQPLAGFEARLKAIYDRREFTPESFAATWLRDSSGYLRLESANEGAARELVKYDCANGKRSVLLGGKRLAPPGSSQPLRIHEFVESPKAGQFLLQANSTSSDRDSDEYWIFDVNSGGLQKLGGNIGGLDWANAFSPDGQKILFRRESNLFTYNIAISRVTPLTTEGIAGEIECGSRAIWSPDGSKIAYIQSDSSEIPKRPYLLQTDPTYPQVRWERYSRVGSPISTLHVGIVDSAGGETKWIDLQREPGTFYIYTLDWAGNSEELLIEVHSRGRDTRSFMIANARLETISTAYQESDPAWVDSSWRANVGLDWIQGGKNFVLLSERDGWRHAFVASRDGKTQALLTTGDYDITDRGPVDETNGWFTFLASPENATQRYLYRIRLDGSAPAERISPADQPGTHSYNFSPDGHWAFHTYSTFDTPPVVDLVHLPDHRVVRVLEDNAVIRDRLKPWISDPTEFLTLDIGEGVVMDAWLIKPQQFDPSKKYPVFVFVYGEPHGQTVLDDWRGGQNHTMFHRAIADLGYLVVSIDNRGTPAPKGAAWRRAVFGSLGPLSSEEQAAGIKELARIRPYVDLSRVGIWGWSGGGSNTLNAMFRKPDVYQVGIAVAPKPQPELYNSVFQENYMRTREENPEGYRQSAPIHFAEGLRGNLLIVVGSGETNTHVQITEGLVDRLIELGKQFDYMNYPNRDHGLREGAGTAVHLRMLMARYLIEHLSPGPSK